MNPSPIDRSVLDALKNQPSRASAAAIGQNFVLNGAPPSAGILGLDILADMMCDWSVAILEEAIADPTRSSRVRRHAITKLREALTKAIRRGYPAISEACCWSLASQAMLALQEQNRQGCPDQLPGVEDLCDHLSQAVEQGYFASLPDF